jgi:hypothetical protein
MTRRPPPSVANRLPEYLRRHGIPWGELSRRTLLPPRLLGRLRAHTANPRLAIAERIAAALDVPIEALWALDRRRR